MYEVHKPVTVGWEKIVATIGCLTGSVLLQTIFLKAIPLWGKLSPLFYVQHSEFWQQLLWELDSPLISGMSDENKV